MDDLRLSVRDLHDPGLKETWNHLVEGGPLYTNTIFQTWEWNDHWWNCFGDSDPTRRQYVLLIERRRHVGCIAPFFIQEKRLLGKTLWRKILWLGTDHIEYPDLITDSNRPEIYWRRIITHCLGTLPRSSFHLWDVLPEGSIHRYLPLDVSLIVRRRGGRVYQALSLKNSVPHRLSGSLARHLRWCERGLSRMGSLEWRYHDSATRTLSRILKQLNRSRFESLSVFTNPREERFFDSITSDGTLKHKCFYALLTLDGRPISILMGFHHRGVLSYYLSGFDPSLRKFSPTSLNISRLLGCAGSLGYHSLDFLRGDESYKRRWGSVERRSEIITLFGRNHSALSRMADVLRKPRLEGR